MHKLWQWHLQLGWLQDLFACLCGFIYPENIQESDIYVLTKFTWIYFSLVTQFVTDTSAGYFQKL